MTCQLHYVDKQKQYLDSPFTVNEAIIQKQLKHKVHSRQSPGQLFLGKLISVVT